MTKTRMVTLTVPGDTPAAALLLAAMRARVARPRLVLAEYSWHMGRWRRRVFLRVLPVLLLALCGCAEAAPVCELEHDAGAELDAGPPCPHVNRPGDITGRASVHDMCAQSCFLEIVCTQPEVPTESCRMRCFYPYDGRTEQHYFAMVECLAAIQPLTCEGWTACMGLP